MKIVTIIGARPQIIKAAALSRAIKASFHGKIEERIVHTGQHYDTNMSEVFFQELGIPKPDINLNVGSGSHGEQTAKMIEGIERVLLDCRPDALVVYGDTNSTLAGAIAASKVRIPVVHIEAGLRSFNKSMPEEINRILTDHVSTLLFTPTRAGYNNLVAEGFKDSTGPFSANNPGIFHCGDVMYDNSLHFSEIAGNGMLDKYNLKTDAFVLCTIHRDSNTDDPQRLNDIFNALIQIGEEFPVVLPIHPRTAKILEERLDPKLYLEVQKNKSVKVIPPASFLDMIALEKNCHSIVTDSGGVQKEAYFFKKPCVILRPQTEWVELVEAGAAQLADANYERILKAWNELRSSDLQDLPAFFGDGKASEFICAKMLESL